MTNPKLRRPWSLARWVWSVLVVAWTVEIIRIYYSKPIIDPGLNMLTSVIVDGGYAGLWFAARRESRQLAAAAVTEAAEAAELRTPRVPDAVWPQCPVCGHDDLEAYAADDELMERGPERAKVVPWGPKRAHWDCAELSPYVPVSRVNDAPLRALCTCGFCGERQLSPSLESSKAWLIAHSKTCPERPKPPPLPTVQPALTMADVAAAFRNLGQWS